MAWQKTPAKRQLDIIWTMDLELNRKDGSTFMCEVIAFLLVVETTVHTP